MNEYYGTSEEGICLDFAYWYRDRIYHPANYSTQPSPEGICFYLGKNQVIYDETLIKIDALGIVLSMANLDWMTDVAGAIYSGYYGDYINASIYTAGVGIPIVTGSLIKGSKDLIKGLRTGASTIVKEGGEYVIRKAVVSKLDEIRNIAKIMDDFPNLRALGNNAESLAEKLLKASDGDTQILSRLNSLPDKTIETFAKDFSQADDILAKFAKDPDLVKAWEVLSNGKDALRSIDNVNAVRAFSMLMDAKFDIAKLSEGNFARLRNIVSKLDDSGLEQLGRLFQEELDVNRMLVYLDNFSFTAEQYTKAMNDIVNLEQFKGTVRVMDKPMNKIDFVNKYLGDGETLMEYYHRSGDGIDYFLKFDPASNHGVVIATDITSKIVVSSGCGFLVNEAKEHIAKIKEYKKTH